MRPRRLRVRGFSSFASLDLDLTQLPDVGIVALVGQTGAGKTTLMDAFGGPAVWWRDLPTHGALREFCVGRDAEIELVYDYAGETYRSLIQVDTEARGGAGKDEAHLFRRDASGAWEPLTPLGRTNDYRDEVLARMPAQDLYMAAAYAAQDRGGSFFALSVPERRKLFERLLGLGALQRRADRAGAAVAVLDALLAEVARDAARVRLDAEQAAGLTADLAAVSAAAGPLDAAEQAAERAVAEADRVLAEASAALAPLEREREAAVARAAELQAGTSRAVREASEARAAVADLCARVAGAAGIRKRAAELVAANAALAVARDAYVAARAHADTRRAEHVAADRVAEEASATHLRARADRERAERAAVDLDAALARVGDVAALRAAAADLSRRVADAEAALLPRLRSNRAESAAADLRLRDARAQLEAAARAADLLDGVPCGGAKVWTMVPDDEGETADERDCGSCQFLTSAQAAATKIPSLRSAIPDLEVDAATARLALDADLAAESDLVALRTERDRAVASVTERAADEASIAALRERASGLDAARATEEAEAARVAELRRVAIDARAVTEAAERAQAEAKRVGQDAAALVASLAGADVALRDLEAAEVALPLAEASLAQATRRMEELDEALSAHVVPPDPDARDADAARITAAAARQSLTEARQASRATDSRAAALRGRLAQLGDVVARAADLEARRAALAQKRAGFALVERAFGDRGIQALEIDAAGPEVSGLVNDLLASCFGPRFTTRLRTVQDAGAGKVMKEVFDVEVLDGMRGGRPCAYRHLSGGQQVMISAALRLALVIANARRHGTQLESLFLDEADTGLDEGLRAAYPSMLRRARELGGFRHVFFISHSQAAWSQADAVIRVEGGSAWIE